MTTDIFISYASTDLKTAQTICTALESRGFSCWISSRDIDPGDDFQESIVNAIIASKVMLFVFSANSNNSDEVKKEIALAGQHKLFVIPVRVEDVTPNPAFAYEFATRQWIDFFDDWDRALDHLSAQIAKVIGGGTGTTAAGQSQSAPSPQPAPVPQFHTPPPVGALPARRGLKPRQYGLIGAGVLAIVVLLALFMIPSGGDKPAAPSEASAAAPDWKDCGDPNDPATTPKPTVAGCTVVLNSDQLTDADRSLALARRGDILFAQNRYDRAITNYNQALKLAPDDSVLFANRANAYLARNGPGDYDNAVSDWDKSIELDPKSAQSYYDRGVAEQQHGHAADGAADIAKAKELDPKIDAQ
jgi:tetratricopeptide (TPR) repeat protein